MPGQNYLAGASMLGRQNLVGLSGNPLGGLTEEQKKFIEDLIRREVERVRAGDNEPYAERGGF